MERESAAMLRASKLQSVLLQHTHEKDNKHTQTQSKEA